MSTLSQIFRERYAEGPANIQRIFSEGINIGRPVRWQIPQWIAKKVAMLVPRARHDATWRTLNAGAAKPVESTVFMHLILAILTHGVHGNGACLRSNRHGQKSIAKTCVLHPIWYHVHPATHLMSISSVVRATAVYGLRQKISPHSR